MQFKSYAEVQFPCRVTVSDGREYRLFGIIKGNAEAGGDRVIGARVYRIDDQLPWCISESMWSTAGLWCDGNNMIMNLPTPPGIVSEHIAALEAEAETLRARIARYPDADPVWIDGDKEALAGLVQKIENLAAVTVEIVSVGSIE